MNAPATYELWEGWTLSHLPEVDSTNPIAGQLPPWHAVRADVQTGGKGRTGRRWVSDKGGLWLSAVVPAEGPRQKWSILPLAAGWAVIGALQDLGVAGLRLRWPNDVMVGDRKLAGLLVEQFRPGTAVVGIGLNVHNRPEQQAPELRATTLADLGISQWPLASLTHLLLGSIRRAHGMVHHDQFSFIATDINSRWGEPRRVELSLNTAPTPLQAKFQGIDAAGRLSVELASGQQLMLEASEVALLTELA